MCIPKIFVKYAKQRNDIPNISESSIAGHSPECLANAQITQHVFGSSKNCRISQYRVVHYLQTHAK
jgi:hypothetical protein